MEVAMYVKYYSMLFSLNLTAFYNYKRAFISIFSDHSPGPTALSGSLCFANHLQTTGSLKRTYIRRFVYGRTQNTFKIKINKL